MTHETWSKGNAESKIIPFLKPAEFEADFSRAWEDAHSPKWRHPADAIRVFISEVVARQRHEAAGEMRAKILSTLSEKSLLGDMAYSGHGGGKTFVKFQSQSMLHYGSYNHAIKDVRTQVESLPYQSNVE